jgi:integrase
MPRKVRDSNLETRTARSRLKASVKPYFRLIEPGLHLGYRRRISGPGTWVVRKYDGAKYSVKNLMTSDGKLVVADDFSDADGNSILTFGQAQERAKPHRSAKAHTPITVAEAVESYIAIRNDRDAKWKGKPVRSDAGHRLRRYVVGQPARGTQPERPRTLLANIVLRALDDADLQEWRDRLPATLSASTKRRLCNDLRAALNAAHAKHRKQLPASLPDTIRFGLKPEDDNEEGADVPDSQVLTDAQITSLLRAARDIDVENEWGADLYRVVAVMAATGARFSQVVRLRVRDCQIAKCRLIMPDSRKGRKKKIEDKPIPVSPEIIDILQPIVVGRAKDHWLLERWRHRQVKVGHWERSERGPWSTSELTRPWKAIRKRAGLPDATPYCLRHSNIVRSI